MVHNYGLMNGVGQILSDPKADPFKEYQHFSVRKSSLADAGLNTISQHYSQIPRTRNANSSLNQYP